MHPYAGNPENYPDNITEIDDSDAPNASNFNTSIEGLGDRTAWLKQAASARAVATWYDPLPTSNLTADVCWDAYVQRWATLDVSSFATTKIDGTNDGRNYIAYNIGYSPSQTTALAVAFQIRPSDGRIVYWKTATSDQHGIVDTIDQSTNPAAATEHLVTSLDGCTNGTMLTSFAPSPTTARFVALGNANPGVALSGGKAAYSDDGVTWASIALPSSWISGSSIISLYLSATLTSPGGGDVALPLIAACGATAGTDVSRLLAVNTGSTPPTAADVTPGFLATTYVIRGIAYDGVNSLVGLLVQKSGGVMSLWTTDAPTRTTWTKVHEWGTTGGGFTAGGLAVIGGVWVVLFHENIRNDGTNRVFYCGNIALGTSCTWSAADFYDTAFITTGNYHRLVSNGSQVFKMQKVLGGGTGSSNIVSNRTPYLAPSAGF